MYPQPMRLACVVFSALLGIALAGCRDTPGAPDTAPLLPLAEQGRTPGQSALRLATVDFYGDSSMIAVPDTAHAGDPVSVGFATYGGGCTGEDTTVASVVGSRAEIVPYQRVYTPRPNEGCTSELRINRRSVHVSFAAPGLAQVIVIGRTQPADSIIHIVRAIVIR